MVQGKLSFKHIIIDKNNPKDPHCKAVGDINGDGYGEFFAASASGEGLFWYSYLDREKHRIADGAFTTDMALGDIDNDGYADVVIPNDDGLMWYRNPQVCGNDSWEATNISPDGARMHDVEIADLDRDGKLDIITRHQSGFGRMMGNQIHVWKQNSPKSWVHQVFDCSHGEGLGIADIDGDGLPDIVIGGCWYKNPGDIINGIWREYPYMPSDYFDQNWTKGDVAVATGDLNGNGRIDIALSPAEGSGHLSWFEAPTDPTSTEWIEHILEPDDDHAHALCIADMDCNGHLDIVVAKMHQATPPQEVAIYLNQGYAKSWTKQVVATSGSHNIAIFDVDGNGYIDIFGANWNDKSLTGGAIELWLNYGFDSTRDK